MNQRYSPHGKQFGNTCLFPQTGFSALGKHSSFLDLVNNKKLGDHQRQALLYLKPCQLAILISRVTPGTITGWCDFKHKKCLRLRRGKCSLAMPSAEEREVQPIFPRSPLPEPADRTVALAPSSDAPACPRLSPAPSCLAPRKAAEL